MQSAEKRFPDPTRIAADAPQVVGVDNDDLRAVCHGRVLRVSPFPSAAAGALTTRRYHLGRAAKQIGVLARTGLWSGPAIPLTNLVDPRSGGVLYGLGSGFLFVDQSPLAGTGGMRYDLAARGTDGSELNFTALAGPQPLPSVGLVTLEMAPAWPNPFNPTTRVRFKAAAGQDVRCRITDVRGRHVRDLYSGTGTGLWQTLTWNGVGDDGAAVASGVYLIRLDSPGGEVTRRVVLAK